jgi:hypothetical protein
LNEIEPVAGATLGKIVLLMAIILFILRRNCHWRAEPQA